MSRYIWVLEILERGQWLPTVGVKLSRREAREELAEWKANNPCSRFRLRKYIAAKDRP